MSAFADFGLVEHVERSLRDFGFVALVRVYMHFFFY